MWSWHRQYSPLTLIVHNLQLAGHHGLLNLLQAGKVGKHVARHICGAAQRVCNARPTRSSVIGAGGIGCPWSSGNMTHRLLGSPNDDNAGRLLALSVVLG